MTKTPYDYGYSSSNSAAANTAAMNSALNSGFVIDGGGDTYSIDAQLLAGSNFKGLQNANLQWATLAAAQTAQYQLRIDNCSNWFVDRVSFNLGGERWGGTVSDSDRGGLRTTSDTTQQNIRITNCTVFGHGAGTGIRVERTAKGVISGNIVRDREVFANSDGSTNAPNDCQNGIHLDSCENMTVSDNIVRRLYSRFNGNTFNKFSRGMTFTSVRHSSVVSNVISDVDQAFDFSGSDDFLGVNGAGGNKAISVTGNEVDNCLTWGFKFANSAQDIIVSGNMVRRFGYGGYVCSGYETAKVTAANAVQRILFVGNYACDPTGAYAGAVCVGFWILSNGDNTNYPQHIRFVSNSVYDSSGAGQLQNGYRCDQTTGKGHVWQLNAAFNFKAGGAVYGGTGISAADFKTL
jgi:hypothetical protein